MCTCREQISVTDLFGSAAVVFQTTKERHMWTCPFHPPIQLYFIIRNTERSADFGISRIKIWNYNRSLNVSARLLSLSLRCCPFDALIRSVTSGGAPFLLSSGWPDCHSSLSQMWSAERLAVKISARGSVGLCPFILAVVHSGVTCCPKGVAFCGVFAR